MGPGKLHQDFGLYVLSHIREAVSCSLEQLHGRGDIRALEDGVGEGQGIEKELP